MKQKLLAFVLVLTALLACSCSRETQEESASKTYGEFYTDGDIETGTIAGDYIYSLESSNSTDSGNILLKYHIPTGTATTVCQDPFCNHNMTCPFSVSRVNIATIGNMLYYTTKEDDEWFLRSYNGDDMKIEQLYTGNGYLSNLFSYNYYLYFSDSKRSDDMKDDVTIYRIDTQSNEIIEINQISDSKEKMLYVRDGRILWETLSGNYYTDLEGDNRKNINNKTQQQYGNYTYRDDWKKAGPGWKIEIDIYMKNISTGEERLVAEDIGPYVFYGGKIIYFKALPERVLVGEIDWVNQYDYYGGNIYIMNLDGSDNRLLCHVDNCYFMFSATNFCGDWIGYPAKNYYEDNNGDKMYTTTDMLIVNIVTGEYKYIAYNPFE